MASPWGWAPWCVTLGPFFVGAMGDDEIHLHVTYASHVGMDAAFCARLRNAIEAGLENAPVGVITTPGTQNPKYVPTEHFWPQVSPLVDMDF